MITSKMFSALFVAWLIPVCADAQGVIVNMYPREVARERQQQDRDGATFQERARRGFTTALQQEARRANPAITGVASLDSAAIDSLNYLDTSRIAAVRAEAYDAAAAEPFRSWTRLTNDEAAKLWPKLSLLPGASVSPGTDETALYTELAQALAGGWRFVLGTALAVQTGGDEGETETPSTAQEGEEEEADPDIGFRRFLAGGGNLSFAGMRPLALRNGTYANHVVVALPRIWSNIPTLSSADGIEDFGGEIAGEYQYMLYARQMRSDPLPELPFLILQFRTGVVLGTNAFYRTIGHDDTKAFAYTVPTLNLNFPNGVRIGASYFYAFGEFSQHENLRFHVSLTPPKREEQSRR